MNGYLQIDKDDIFYESKILRLLKTLGLYGNIYLGFLNSQLPLNINIINNINNIIKYLLHDFMALGNGIIDEIRFEIATNSLFDIIINYADKKNSVDRCLEIIIKSTQNNAILHKKQYNLNQLINMIILISMFKLIIYNNDNMSSKFHIFIPDDDIKYIIEFLNTNLMKNEEK